MIATILQMKKWDAIFGAGGVIASFTVAQYNALMGAVGVTISVVILAFRLRREVRHRNDPPERKE